MSKFTNEDILRIVREEDVKFIRLQFTDLSGATKNLAITENQLQKALAGNCAFDVSAIRGFEAVEESEMYLKPDLDSVAIFPWRPQQGKVMRLISDVVHADGTPFSGDSRHILKAVLKEAADLGYTLNVGPECEFFLFHTDEEGNPTTKTHDAGGYFDIAPLDMGENCRRDICLTLEDMGFMVESSHHEMAKGQHEVDFRYDEALATADKIMTFKMVVKSIAQRHGLYATFMPKPVEGEAGSGMHVNISLMKDGKNVFSDPEDPNGFSPIAMQFLGGVMAHLRGMTAITNPLVNSYKRLLPETGAPVYIAWSKNAPRSLACAMHAAGENSRLELRSPDSSANPYLALALILKAGLWGIRQAAEAPESISAQSLKTCKAERLPETLKEALTEMTGDSLVKEVLGEDTLKAYLAAKTREVNEYQAQVTRWEIERYLSQY